VKQDSKIATATRLPYPVTLGERLARVSIATTIRLPYPITLGERLARVVNALIWPERPRPARLGGGWLYLDRRPNTHVEIAPDGSPDVP